MARGRSPPLPESTGLAASAWGRAREAARALKPADRWREGVALAIWETGEAALVGVFTCPPDQPHAGKGATIPPELAAAIESTFFGRILPQIERVGLGVAKSRRVGNVAHDPVTSHAAEVPRLVQEVVRDLLSPAGAAGMLNAFLLDARHQMVGWITLGTRRSGADAAQVIGAELTEVARAASATIGVAQDLARACGASIPQSTRASIAVLSRREREVVQLVAAGFSDLNVGAKLEISEHTVGVHLRRIYAKLSVHSRVELLLQTRGWFEGDAEHGRPQRTTRS